MRSVRKFVSLLALASIGAAPLAAAGCAEQPAVSTSSGQASTDAPKADTAKPAVPKGKKAKKAKPAGAESASTTGPGVTPPLKN